MKTDIAILGGGLAGLTAAIIANRMGHSVVLVEKKQYPFHKVCGEYISLEAENLLRWLGLPIEEWRLPVLDQFRITHSQARDFSSKLPLGGIGISRFKLDEFLKDLAEKEGVKVLQNTRVESINREDDLYLVQTNGHENGPIESKLVFGAFGRNKPHFALSEKEEETKTKGFIGVKMHVLADLPKDRIELHHFPGGYCGISAIENGSYCLCYLIDANSVKNLKGDFQKVEDQILSINPELKRYLTTFEKITQRVSTAGVFFTPRPLSQNGMLFLGDSAGMIPPLAGNGMSMALHSAVLATESAHQFFSGKLKYEELSTTYENAWNQQFASRLKTARMLQNLMQTSLATRLSMNLFSFSPSIFRFAARQTHGIQIPIPPC